MTKKIKNNKNIEKVGKNNLSEIIIMLKLSLFSGRTYYPFTLYVILNKLLK